MGSSYAFNKRNVEDTIGLDNSLDGVAHTAGAVVGVGEIAVAAAEGAKDTYDLLKDEEKRTQAINAINKMVDDGTLVDTVLDGMKEGAKQVMIDKVVADLYDDAYDEGKADVKIVLALAGAATGVGAVAGATAKLALKTTDAIKDAIAKQAAKQAAKKVDLPDVKPDSNLADETASLRQIGANNRNNKDFNQRINIDSARADAKAKGWKDDGNKYIYPDNKRGLDAIAGTVKDTELKVGDVVTKYVPKRYNNGELVPYDPKLDSGKYVSKGDVSFEQRSLPGKESAYTKEKFVVKKIPEGKDSKATPWFNQKGGGDQTNTKEGIKDLEGNGYFEYIGGQNGPSR